MIHFSTTLSQFGPSNGQQIKMFEYGGKKSLIPLQTWSVTSVGECPEIVIFCDALAQFQPSRGQ